MNRSLIAIAILAVSLTACSKKDETATVKAPASTPAPAAPASDTAGPAPMTPPADKAMDKPAADASAPAGEMKKEDAPK